MSTPPTRTSRDSASQCAWAAMDRKPCGPASARHQISGPPVVAGRLRRIVRPASAKCSGRSAGRSDCCAVDQGADDDRGRRDRGLRPPGCPADDGGAEGQERRPVVDIRRIEDEHHALVVVTLPRWSQRVVDDRRGDVDGAREQGPGARAERMTGRVRLESGVQAELGDEAVVVGRELAVHTGRERVGVEFLLQQGCRVGPPARALAEPGERAGADELPGRLGDHVVVRRRATALGTRRGSAGASRSAGARARCARTGR